MFKELLNLFEFVVERKFKIAIISYYYPYQKPSTSGVGTHVYNLVTNLAKLGCEVHVFCSSEKDSVKKISLKKGKIIIHFLNSNFKFDIQDSIVEKRIKYALFENKVLNEFVCEHLRRPFKIVHTHGWLTSSAFMIKHLYNIPWVHTVHALERNRLKSMTNEEKQLFKITSWIEDTLANADKLICVSKSIQKEMTKAFKDIKEKTIVIPNGVNLELFKEGKNNKRTVLTVSRLSQEKGSYLLPEIIEDVLSKVKNSKFIVIIQETKLPSLLEIQNKFKEFEKKYPKRFIWISHPISALELVNYYQGSGVYVQPSLYESFGLCILEAMACGNAVVATNVGGIPEAAGNVAILVEPNAKKISAKIIKLFKDNSLREKYKKLSLEHSKLFDWRNIGKKVMNVYEELSK